MLKDFFESGHLIMEMSSWHEAHRKEVIKMVDKKENCGCGCTQLKEKSTNAPKDKKKGKSAK